MRSVSCSPNVETYRKGGRSTSNVILFPRSSCARVGADFSMSRFNIGKIVMLISHAPVGAHNTTPRPRIAPQVDLVESHAVRQITRRILSSTRRVSRAPALSSICQRLPSRITRSGNPSRPIDGKLVVLRGSSLPSHTHLYYLALSLHHTSLPRTLPCCDWQP